MEGVINVDPAPAEKEEAPSERDIGRAGTVLGYRI
jgi:hypothetical protein